MIVQLVEDIEYNISKQLHGVKLQRVSSRSYTINKTENRLVSVHGNKFSGLSNELQFKHITKPSGLWESWVLDLINKTEKLIAYGYFVKGEDII